MKKLMIVLVFVFFALISLGFASAQPQSPTVCCEKTLSGLSCQDVPQEQCDPNAKQVPTSCEATSYCKPGTCFNTNEGTCLDNTPQNTCNLNGGIWTDKPAPQCELGCCVLGDQAAFVTLTRCKKLSADLGLMTNYKKEIKDEVSCIDTVLGQEKGACVYEFEFQTTCRITTREACTGGISETQTEGMFFKGKLCTAKDLDTICGPSTNKACVPGKEEVYFVDTCGNPSNVYDSSMASDANYWEDILDKSESCNPDSPNINSATCGNCNYLEGSVCRTNSGGNAKCTDLNCYSTSNGNNYKHGESWCVNSDPSNSVGSRFYKHICINGEEVLEQCDDFRQQICIGGSISYTGGTFSQAACRVNRWRDCTSQSSRSNCENTDKRDCTWIGRCVPIVPPGLKFWGGSEAQAVCGQASTTCIATYEKGLIEGFGLSKEEEWEGDCVNDDGDVLQSWVNNQGAICHALGDCVGTAAGGVSSDTKKMNWLGVRSRSGN